MARNRFCPSMLMKEMSETSRSKRFRDVYLTEDFRNIPLNDSDTFASMYMPDPQVEHWQKKFMTPIDDSRNPLCEVSGYNYPDIIALQLTCEMLQGLSDNAKEKELPNKIDYDSVTKNASYEIGYGCPEDIAGTQDPEDKFLILLLYSMFGTRYEEAGVRDKVRDYLLAKDPEWPHSRPVSTDPELMNMKLSCGFEETYYSEWNNSMFLEPGDHTALLGDCYVLPPCKAGRSKGNDLMDYMSGIIEETSRTKPISLILGGPGSGKTTLFSAFLNRRDIVSCKNDLDEQVYIYQGKKRIFLYRFNKFNDTDLWKPDRSAATLASELLSRIGAENVRGLHKTILLLDGFDECAATPEQRRGLLHIFAEEWGKYARIFITCRYHYINLSDLDQRRDNISVIELQPFAWEQIRSFICRYKKWDPDVAETQEGLELYRKIMDEGHKKEEDKEETEEEPANIYGIPIILYMVMAMEENLKLEPGMSKGRIYGQIFQKDNGIYDRMIKGTRYDRRTDKFSPNGIYLTGEKIDAYKFLLVRLTREIAHYMFRTGSYQNVLKKEIEDLYKENFRKFEDSAGNEVDLGRLLSSGLFMIVDTPEGGNPSDATLRFVHKSIYEYFVADYLFSEMIRVSAATASDTRLIGLLQEAQVSDEIGDFLEERLKASNLDTFIAGLTVLLTDQRLSAQAFENLISITQRFRAAENCKDKEHLLFQGDPEAQELLVRRLKEFRCSGPNDHAFDLTYLDLAGLDLSHTDLSYYDLSGCDCTETNFRHTQLDFCKLEGTVLKGAAFTAAGLWHTVPSANELFDASDKEIPWTRFEGYIEKRIDLNKVNGLLMERPTFGNMTEKGKFLAQYQFGQYPQKTATPEPILWDVLEIRGNRALLWSHDILDVVPYNEEYEDTNWASCSLRRWMNTEFLETAFNEKESKRICQSLIEPHRNIDRDYKTEQGPAAIDRVFLLSGQELVRYCADPESKHEYGLDWEKSKAKVNAHSKKAEGRNKGYGYYWLRSVGYSARLAVSVYSDGDVDTDGVNVLDGNVGVRPALWITLES